MALPTPWLRTVGGIALLALTGCFAGAARADWPMFRHDAARSGGAEGPGPTATEIAWTVELAGPVDSAPAVSGGMVFATTAAGTVHAVDATSGEERWRATIGAPVVSSPATDGERVYFGCTDNYLYALSAVTGEQVWQARTGRSVIASPLLADGKLICGSTDGRLYALSAETGGIIWRTEAGGEIHAGAAAAGAFVVYGDWDKRLYCVSLADGSPVWTAPYRAEGPFIAPPAIAGGVVVASSLAPTAIQPPDSLNIHVLELTTGKRAWGALGTNPWQTDKEGKFSVSTCPTVVGDQVWFVAGEGYGNWSAQLRSCALATGARGFAAGRGQPGPNVSFTDSSAAVAGSILYLADYSGTLSLFDTANLRPLQSLPLGARTRSSPAIADGCLYIGLTDGRLLCIR